MAVLQLPKLGIQLFFSSHNGLSALLLHPVPSRSSLMPLSHLVQEHAGKRARTAAQKVTTTQVALAL